MLNKKQLSEQEKHALMIKANEAICEYLHNTISYNTLLEVAAEGEAEIISLLDEYGIEACNKKAISSLVMEFLRIIKLLKPFAQIDGQV